MEPEGSSLHRYRGRKLMSFVTAQPESLAAAAGSLAGIGASMSSGSAAAASPTTGVVPAADDEVSALTAAQFAAHAEDRGGAGGAGGGVGGHGGEFPRTREVVSGGGGKSRGDPRAVRIHVG